ncbi:alpha/beta fold hydrolase [Aeromicrobium sp. CTD01-1L150]|uniref:alpha/beta fold hydrolase n=1 Tax=Aeromicrobium sp. CTD01-1L150 TaxID=3341830 RepID=UPI0035C26166
MAGSGEQFAHLPSGIDICHETFGDTADPPVLLVMGLGGPMGWWAMEFCEELAAEGLFVIRYDNRDTGRSTKLRQYHVSKLDIVKAAVGMVKNPPYRLGDLADDAFGLLDHLGIDQAHLVGVSMGGMIVQTMAIDRPERALSMTSIMSTTGRRTVGYQHPRVLPGLFASSGRTRDEYVARSLRATAMIASPDYPTTDEDARARAHETYDRGWTASGVARQLMAILTQTDRTAALADLDLPVTVVHGLKDPLVHRSGGKATADAIPRAEHIEIPGMAHDLPVQLHGTFIEAITGTIARSVHR